MMLLLRRSSHRLQTLSILRSHSARYLSTNASVKSVSKEASSGKFSSRTVLALAVAGIGIGSSLFYFNDNTSDGHASTHTVNSMEERVKILEGEVAKLKVSRRNKAFVFIKPEAVTEQVENLILKKFEDVGIKVTKSGVISGKQIDEEYLIDTHYGAIAAKAVTLPARDLNLTAKARTDFKKLSGNVEWDDALKEGNVYNAREYCELKGINGQDLDKQWSKLKRGENLMKFGGGFYCGKLGENEYVINGFYMAMRDKFTGENDKIKYFAVEFPPEKVSWESFRNDILGTTDPVTSPKGSLRRAIYDNWKKLGLDLEPSTGNNGVHASASPFEAFAERCNWLKHEFQVESDDFGVALIRNGVDLEKVQSYMQDPAVEFEGTKQSIFDILEDLDSEDCLDRLIEISKS